MIKVGFHNAIWAPLSPPPQDLRQAVADLDAVGWDGFETTWGHLGRFGLTATEFKDVLKGSGLEVSAVYTGGNFVDRSQHAQEIKRITEVADFCVEVGAGTLLLDGGLKRPGANRDDDIKAVAEVSNRLGEMAKSKGLQASWHQHWGSLFEFRDEFYRLMELTDPDLLHFTPDTGQLTLGWMNAVEVVRDFADRLSYVHYKDLDRNRRFIELGDGTIDFPAIWQIMKDAGFEGWIVVDLDYTKFHPKESCARQLDYLNNVLGIPTARSKKA